MELRRFWMDGGSYEIPVTPVMREQIEAAAVASRRVLYSEQVMLLDEIGPLYDRIWAETYGAPPLFSD